MVRLTVVLMASPRRAVNLVEAFRSLMLRTRLEQGCIDCSVWSDPDSTVHYFEEWETEADIRRRVRSDLFTSLLAVVEGSQKPPEVRFDFLTTSRGLDYVAEIRQTHE
jgi:quinol monooxygenase YgiN